MYRIRDERGVFSDIWASGIARRAVLSAGRRLAETGRIGDAEHFIDAGFDEMCSMLSGAGGPSSEELASRFGYRTTHSRQGGSGSPGSFADAPARPLRPAARGGPGHARHWDRAGRAVRELRGGT